LDFDEIWLARLQGKIEFYQGKIRILNSPRKRNLD
jgi:hypothetical protein